MSDAENTHPNGLAQTQTPLSVPAHIKIWRKYQYVCVIKRTSKRHAVLKDKEFLIISTFSYTEEILLSSNTAGDLQLYNVNWKDLQLQEH